MTKYRQTDIGRRIQRGESVPAWRPAGTVPSHSALFDSDDACMPEPRFAERLKQADLPPVPTMLPLGERPISALEAREAARAVNEWCKTGAGEIETAKIRLLCQWALRVTRGAE